MDFLAQVIDLSSSSAMSLVMSCDFMEMGVMSPSDGCGRPFLSERRLHTERICQSLRQSPAWIAAKIRAYERSIPDGPASPACRPVIASGRSPVLHGRPGVCQAAAASEEHGQERCEGTGQACRQTCGQSGSQASGQGRRQDRGQVGALSNPQCAGQGCRRWRGGRGRCGRNCRSRSGPCPQGRARP